MVVMMDERMVVMMVLKLVVMMVVYLVDLMALLVMHLVQVLVHLQCKLDYMMVIESEKKKVSKWVETLGKLLRSVVILLELLS